jgi:hypothetical protein
MVRARIWLSLVAMSMAVFVGSASAQTRSLFGVNPFSNDASSPPGSFGLFYVHPDTGAIFDGRVITVPGRTIVGAQGLALDPTTGQVYAIVTASGVSGRLLVRLDLATGAGTEVGNLGDNFSSIAFRGGQLFGVTGDGAAVPETLYLVDKSSAAKIVVRTLGNGNDGEVIAYHPPSDSFFHWSGNLTIVFERIQATPPFTVTNIPITGSTSGEVFGAVWDPVRGQFLVHNIISSMDFWTTTGVRSNAQPETLEDVRGMVLIDAPASAVPTLSEWAMVLLALLMMATAWIAMRRARGSSRDYS